MARSSTKKMRSKRGKKSGSRRGRMSKRMRLYGGANMNPAGVSDNSMLEAGKMSLAQGRDYLSHHTAQHGGMAPVGYTGVLDDSLRATARVAVLDESMGAIQGMSDQSGGGKRRGMTMKKMKCKKCGQMMKNCRKGMKCKKCGGTMVKSGGGKMMYGGQKMCGGKMMYGGQKMMAMHGGQKMCGGKMMYGGQKMCGGKMMYGGQKMGMMGGKMMYGGQKMCGGKMMYGGKKRMTMKKMKKGKKGTRRMRGGFAYALSQAQDYSAPGMLLSPAGEARALAGMNPEWKLATDPSAFAPKLM